MRQLGTAIINLIKSYFARPVRPQNSSLHWVKADKPIGEMTTFERNEFANHLADEMFSSVIPEPSKKTLQKKDKDFGVLFLGVLLIGLLVFVNWEKVPVYGSNAKALVHAKIACNAKSLGDAAKEAAFAANLDRKWLQLQTLYANAVVLQSKFSEVAFEYSEGDLLYINAKSELLKPVYEASYICTAINK